MRTTKNGKRVGRPPDGADSRPVRVVGLVSVAEFALIEAAKGEETVSSFVRRNVLAACGALENTNTTD